MTRPDRPSMQDAADRKAELEQAQRALDAQVQGWERDNELLDAKLAEHDQRAADAAPDPGPTRHAQAVQDFVARTRQQAAEEQRAHDNATRQANEDPMPAQADPFVDLMQQRREMKRQRRRNVVGIITRRGSN